MNKREIDARCTALVRFWNRRNRAMKNWYQTIRMVDVLAEPNMESFVSNDPRTFYNMALNLLDPGDIPHRIPTEGLTPAQVLATSGVERLVDVSWRKLGAKNRRRGRVHPITEIVKFLLCFGWYSVFARASEDELVAEVWNPVEVYPNWTDDGLMECAHVYTVTEDEANRKCELNEWRKPTKGHKGTNIQVRDYWNMDENGRVFNAVSIGNTIAKRWIETGFPFIPIFIAPIGGLPDRGAVTGSDVWKEEIGQAVTATNQAVYENYNKQLTFLQQLMRDVATPRWLELSEGDIAILKREDMFKRGAIFRGAPGDDVRPLQVPPIPVEAQSQLFTIQGQLQRGGLPWQIYGNLQETVSAYLLTQVASAARKILRAYHDGVIAVLTDIDNLWVEQVLEHNYNPWGWQVPQELPVDTYMTAAYSIDIPGDMVLRATVARMISGDFGLSITTTMDLMFPEIENPEAELNRVIADKAELHPVNVSVQLAQAYRQKAREMAEAGDTEQSELYQMAFAAVVQTIAQVAAVSPEAGRGAGGSPMPRGGLPAMGETVAGGGE